MKLKVMFVLAWAAAMQGIPWGLYWTTKFPLDVRGVADVMSINCFQQLFRCLHLADNSAQIPVGQPGHDRLFKVRGLLNLLIPKFESEYPIHQECAIDEAMIPFKGRLAFKQYMKAKSTRVGRGPSFGCGPA